MAADAAGEPDFTFKDPPAKRQTRDYKGQGAAPQLLGDVVQPCKVEIQLQQLYAVRARSRGCRRRPARQVREREAVRREDEDDLSGAGRRPQPGHRRCWPALRAADVVHHLARRPGLQTPRPPGATKDRSPTPAVKDISTQIKALLRSSRVALARRRARSRWRMRRSDPHRALKHQLEYGGKVPDRSLEPSSGATKADPS